MRSTSLRERAWMFSASRSTAMSFLSCCSGVLEVFAADPPGAAAVVLGRQPGGSREDGDADVDREVAPAIGQAGAGSAEAGAAVAIERMTWAITECNGATTVERF